MVAILHLGSCTGRPWGRMREHEYLAGWMECRLQICLFQGLNIAIELVISSKDFFWKAPIVAL